MLVGSIFRSFEATDFERIFTSLQALFLKMEENSMMWNLYCIAKESMICGYFPLSHFLLKKIESHIEGEENSCWIQSLIHITELESNLFQNNCVKNHTVLLNDSQILLNVFFIIFTHRPFKKTHFN